MILWIVDEIDVNGFVIEMLLFNIYEFIVMNLNGSSYRLIENYELVTLNFIDSKY